MGFFLSAPPWRKKHLRKDTSKDFFVRHLMRVVKDFEDFILLNKWNPQDSQFN